MHARIRRTYKLPPVIISVVRNVQNRLESANYLARRERSAVPRLIERPIWIRAHSAERLMMSHGYSWRAACVSRTHDSCSRWL